MTSISGVVDGLENDIAKGFTWVSHLYTAAEQKFSAVMKDEPQIVAALSSLVETGEAFLGCAAPAIGAKGLDLPADSAAFAAFEAFLKSFEQAATQLKTAVKDIQ